MTQNTPWVKAAGLASQIEFDTTVNQNAPCDAQYYMAHTATQFLSGFVQVVEDATGSTKVSFRPQLPALDDILEVRIFHETAELWLHRSMRNAAFSWRVADDTVLADTIQQDDTLDAFLKDAQHYRLTQRQYLSNDAVRSERLKPQLLEPFPHDAAQKQLKCFCAVGGGQYALPMLEGDAADYDSIQVVDYIAYDTQTGQAIPTDFRIAGFVKGGV